MPRGVKMSKEKIETLERMTREGYTQGQICEAVGFGVETVRKYQKIAGLKASNRWRYGESAEIRVPDLGGNEIIPLNPETVPQPVPGEWVQLTYKVIRLKGVRTNFDYEIGLFDTALKIKPGYSEDIEIDLKDLIAFGNEILDVAEKINELKGGKWG